MDKLERLRKIKELAENGCLGEKTAALETYERLKAIYNISDDLISQPAAKRHEFRYNKDYEKKLMSQIIYMVCGDVQICQICGKRILTAETTDFEAAKIGLHYEIYAAAIKKHMQAAYIAFVQANGIFPDENVRVHDKNKQFAKPADDVTRAAAALATMTSKTFVPCGLLEGA